MAFIVMRTTHCVTAIAARFFELGSASACARDAPCSRLAGCWVLRWGRSGGHRSSSAWSCGRGRCRRALCPCAVACRSRWHACFPARGSGWRSGRAGLVPCFRSRPSSLAGCSTVGAAWRGRGASHATSGIASCARALCSSSDASEPFSARHGAGSIVIEVAFDSSRPGRAG